MSRHNKLIQFAIAFLCSSFLLTACTGGSDSEKTNSTTNTDPMLIGKWEVTNISVVENTLKDVFDEEENMPESISTEELAFMHFREDGKVELNFKSEEYEKQVTNYSVEAGRLIKFGANSEKESKSMLESLLENAVANAFDGVNTYEILELDKNELKLRQKIIFRNPLERNSQELARIVIELNLSR
ncbi:MAG: hypothetical protein JJT94_07765 [Bernardetiaceae bacterium]|nr:hypothetical protein [Bernardetiaceae bacterium]